MKLFTLSRRWNSALKSPSVSGSPSVLLSTTCGDFMCRSSSPGCLSSFDRLSCSLSWPSLQRFASHELIVSSLQRSSTPIHKRVLPIRYNFLSNAVLDVIHWRSKQAGLETSNQRVKSLLRHRLSTSYHFSSHFSRSTSCRVSALPKHFWEK